MHVAQEFAEGHVVLEVEHIAEGLNLARVVVEHQEHASERKNDEQIESDPAHSPGVAVAHCITIDFGGMEMEEDVRKNAEGAIARDVVVLVAEDRSEYLGLGGFAQDLDLLFGFRRQVGLEGLEVLLDAGFDTLDQADRFAIFPVSLVLVRHC